MSNYTSTYALRVEEIQGITHYFIAFKDGRGLFRETEVSRPVYLEFQRSAREEQNQARWSRRHIEQSELTDQSLYDRALHKPKALEEVVLDNLCNERLAQTVAMLSETMRRRFVLYHDFGLTYQQIAEMEGCTKMPVKRSIDRAEEKIRENFRK